MPHDKKLLYTLSAVIVAGLLPPLFLTPDVGLPLTAVWLSLAAVAVCCLVRWRPAPSLTRHTVLLLTVAFVLLYFTLLYLSGLHFGFVKAPVPFGLASLFYRILPIALVTVASEIVRRALLSRGPRAAAVLAYSIAFLGELAIGGGFGGITHFNALMDVLGLAFFPAISTGFLCQFASARHGILPPIAYRLLFRLVPYFIPVTPAVPDAFLSLAALLLPLLLLSFLKLLFEKREKRATASPRLKRLGLASAALGILLSVGLISLISGQFRYGTIVIATGSMAGELNVGDAILYERYEGEQIEEGDVIVFRRDSSLVVHRVVEIAHINGETRYYTKGDANKDRDVGFVTSRDVVGITDFKISYIGYPSLWMRRIFEVGS